MSNTESYVQVATDGSGKKVRNKAVVEPIPAATPDLPDIPTTVYQQIVVLADKNGEPIDFADLVRAIDELKSVTIQLRELIALAVS